MMDDYNQNDLNARPAGMTLHYPDDSIANYTPELLVFLLPQMRGNIVTGDEAFWSVTQDIRYVLKMHKPQIVTDEAIDRLFSIYNNPYYWIGQWPEGLWK